MRTALLYRTTYTIAADATKAYSVRRMFTVTMSVREGNFSFGPHNGETAINLFSSPAPPNWGSRARPHVAPDKARRRATRARPMSARFFVRSAPLLLADLQDQRSLNARPA